MPNSAKPPLDSAAQGTSRTDEAVPWYLTASQSCRHHYRAKEAPADKLQAKGRCC